MFRSKTIRNLDSTMASCRRLATRIIKVGTASNGEMTATLLSIRAVGRASREPCDSASHSHE